MGYCLPGIQDQSSFPHCSSLFPALPLSFPNLASEGGVHSITSISSFCFKVCSELPSPFGGTGPSLSSGNLPSFLQSPPMLDAFLPLAQEGEESYLPQSLHLQKGPPPLPLPLPTAPPTHPPNVKSYSQVKRKGGPLPLRKRMFSRGRKLGHALASFCNSSPLHSPVTFSHLFLALSILHSNCAFVVNLLFVFHVERMILPQKTEISRNYEKGFLYWARQAPQPQSVGC